MEVNGFNFKLNTALRPIDIALPSYIPTFYHGFPGTTPLEIEWIALPLHCLFKSASGDKIKWLADDGRKLRAALGLHRNTKIILTGPEPDQLIEDFWRFHRHANLLSLLKALDIQIFTVPNYSFFTDAPPLHHNYNRSRILRVAERASEAGIFSVLHLNAIREETWQDWEALIKRHPEIKYVCLEFQTGYTNQNLALAALNRLVKLQKNIQRPLHPILIGAARHAGFVGEHFLASTIIDAQPFLHTFSRDVFRELPDGKFDWHFSSTKPLESIVPRFKSNFLKYSERIRQRLAGVPAIRQDEFVFPPDLSGPLVSSHKQQSFESLPLFRQVRKPLEQTAVQESGLNSARSTVAPAAPQIAVETKRGLSKSKLATNRPNFHRKNNLHKRQPNEFDEVSNMGVAVGH